MFIIMNKLKKNNKIEKNLKKNFEKFSIQNFKKIFFKKFFKNPAEFIYRGDIK